MGRFARSWELAKESAKVLMADKELIFFPVLSACISFIAVIILTAINEVNTAVECMKCGAFDYLVKPVEGEAILSGLLAERTNDFRMPQQECMPLEELEKSHITRVLAANKGNISRTAQVLDMHRRTLQRKLSRFLPSSRGAAARSSAFGK